jgi:hypothetical protein
LEVFVKASRSTSDGKPRLSEGFGAFNKLYQKKTVNYRLFWAQNNLKQPKQTANASNKFAEIEA